MSCHMRLNVMANVKISETKKLLYLMTVDISDNHFYIFLFFVAMHYWPNRLNACMSNQRISKFIDSESL
jgi:hypothetical protein